MDLRLLLKISRPGLWLVFVWLYLWPTATQQHILSSLNFWLGLLFCIFPLNLFVYGFNDMVDTDTDKINKRKGNFIFGAKASKKDLSKLPRIMAVMMALCSICFIWLTQDVQFYLVWFIAVFFVNAAYNLQPLQLSRRGPFEVPCMITGHLLIPVMSCRLNGLELPGIGSWYFHCLLLSRSHIWLEMMDIREDAKTNKRTIAVMLGHRLSLALVSALTIMEGYVGFVLLQSNMLGVFSSFGLVVLLGMSFIEVDKQFACISQSVIGFLVMTALWIRGDLLK